MTPALRSEVDYPLLDQIDNDGFQPINRGFNATFRPNSLSLGLVLPLDAHGNNPVPNMTRHAERVRLAEELGFTAVWLRDVPFNVPSFGDAGQIHDPFVYLGFLAAQTNKIALGVASIILPLRHPAHVAKAASSADVLSEGRLILGVASGDRPEEYPALNLSFSDRGERFRSSFEYIQNMWSHRPAFENPYGSPYGGMDMLPKPVSGRIPLLITGGSQQDPNWIANNGDGWMTYPRDIRSQARIVQDWRTRIRESGSADKPAMQSLYINLLESDARPAEPIHLGFRSGPDFLIQYLSSLRDIGINHVALNLRFNTSDVETTMERLAEDVFPAIQTKD